MEEWWPALREGDLVAYLTGEEHARLLAVTELCAAPAGELIFEKGSRSASLLLIEEGAVEVFDRSMGQEVTLAIVGPGGVVGEVGFVDGQARTHNVRTREACRMRRLTRAALLGLVSSDPVLFAKLALSLSRLLAHRLRAAVEELEPVRAFSATLHEPIDLRDAAPGYDEIEEPLPEADPDLDPQEAVRVMRDVARKSRRKRSSDASGV